MAINLNSSVLFTGDQYVCRFQGEAHKYKFKTNHLGKFEIIETDSAITEYTFTNINEKLDFFTIEGWTIDEEISESFKYIIYRQGVYNNCTPVINESIITYNLEDKKFEGSFSLPSAKSLPEEMPIQIAKSSPSAGTEYADTIASLNKNKKTYSFQGTFGYPYHFHEIQVCTYIEGIQSSWSNKAKAYSQGTYLNEIQLIKDKPEATIAFENTDLIEANFHAAFNFYSPTKPGYERRNVDPYETSYDENTKEWILYSQIEVDNSEQSFNRAYYYLDNKSKQPIAIKQLFIDTNEVKSDTKDFKEQLIKGAYAWCNYGVEQSTYIDGTRYCYPSQNEDIYDSSFFAQQGLYARGIQQEGPLYAASKIVFSLLPRYNDFYLYQYAPTTIRGAFDKSNPVMRAQVKLFEVEEEELVFSTKILIEDSGIIYSPGQVFEYQLKNNALDPSKKFLVEIYSKTKDGIESTKTAILRFTPPISSTNTVDYSIRYNKLTSKISIQNTDVREVSIAGLLKEKDSTIAQQILAPTYMNRESQKEWLFLPGNYFEKTTQYIGLSYLSWGKYGKDYYAYSSTEVPPCLTSTIEDIVLVDASMNRELKVRYNPDLTNLKRNYIDTITPTLGSQYPVIRRSGGQLYYTFNIGGLISSEGIPLTSIWFTDSDRNIINFLSNDPYQQKLITERLFRDHVLEFLNNDHVKFFYSPQEGAKLIRLTNVSLTPNKQLDRLIYSFTAQATEVAPFSLENLVKYGV